MPIRATIQNIADKSVESTLAAQLDDIPAVGMIIAFLFGIFIASAFSYVLAEAEKWTEKEALRGCVGSFIAGAICASIASAFSSVWSMWWLMAVTGFVGGLASLILVPLLISRYGSKQVIEVPEDLGPTRMDTMDIERVADVLETRQREQDE